MEKSLCGAAIGREGRGARMRVTGEVQTQAQAQARMQGHRHTGKVEVCREGCLVWCCCKKWGAVLCCAMMPVQHPHSHALVVVAGGCCRDGDGTAIVDAGARAIRQRTRKWSALFENSGRRDVWWA